jgi:DUF1680 family protein
VNFEPAASRCCTFNSGAGWPQFTQHLWFATPDNGLAAVLYAPCEVRAKVGHDVDATINVNTEYPFTEDVEITFKLPKEVAFPLSLRVPGWCDGAQVLVNKELKMVRPTPGNYVIIERKWKDGDAVTLRFPMPVVTKTWKKQNDAISIHRGPLAYSLKLGEDWKRSGDTIWPNYEVEPKDPWNFALDLATDEARTGLEITKRTGIKVGQIFYNMSAPHIIKVKAYPIPDWKLDDHGLVGQLPKSPVTIDPAATPVDVELIPMGCARLRVSMFPLAKTSAN